jgi:hypothetical protein
MERTRIQRLARDPGSRHPVLIFMCAFAAVFAGLALLHGPGPSYSKAHAALGNLLLKSIRLTSGVRMRFEAPDAELAIHPWSITLQVQASASGAGLSVPIDLRSLIFLPTAAFIALAIAAPLGSVRSHLRLIGIGLLILEPLLLLLVALPLLSFLGGTGPVRAFVLSRPMLVILQVLYRALVAPPGMTYAVPLLLWWALVSNLNAGRHESSAPGNPE